jgi:hypothetical protein
MLELEDSARGLDTLLFAEELEERLETCICVMWDCDGKGPWGGCWNCVGWGCGDTLET